MFDLLDSWIGPPQSRLAPSLHSYSPTRRSSPRFHQPHAARPMVLCAVVCFPTVCSTSLLQGSSCESTYCIAEAGQFRTSVPAHRSHFRPCAFRHLTTAPNAGSTFSAADAAFQIYRRHGSHRLLPTRADAASMHVRLSLLQIIGVSMPSSSFLKHPLCMPFWG